MQTLTLTCRIKIVCCLLLFALSAMGQKQKAMRITYKVVYTYSSDLAPRHDVSYLDVQEVRRFKTASIAEGAFLMIW